MWELEERHLQEKHQLFKQQLKDQYFMQRHQLLKRHEKVCARWGEELSSNSFTHLNFFCNSSDFRITLICYFTVKNSLKIRVQHFKKKKAKKNKVTLEALSDAVCHVQEMEQMQRYNQRLIEEMKNKQTQERTRLPKIQRSEAKTRMAMFKKSLRITGAAITPEQEREKVKQVMKIWNGMC